VRWRRILIVPLLATVHACDCGGCGGDDSAPSSSSSCGSSVSCGASFACGIGGQCASEAGACPGSLRLDTTMTCDDAGTFCCVLPLPLCPALGGVCVQGPDDATSGAVCTFGELPGDCLGHGFCCSAPPGDDGAEEAFAVPPSDAQGAPDAEAMGSCNGAPCASGCVCGPTATDGGGGTCQCAALEAGADADARDLDADGGDAPVEGSSPDAETNEGAAPVDDASPVADAQAEARAPESCGVISCDVACACTSVATSACVCP
jgi:hypothetical protein